MTDAEFGQIRDDFRGGVEAELRVKLHTICGDRFNAHGILLKQG